MVKALTPGQQPLCTATWAQKSLPWGRRPLRLDGPIMPAIASAYARRWSAITAATTWASSASSGAANRYNSGRLDQPFSSCS